MLLFNVCKTLQYMNRISRDASMGLCIIVSSFYCLRLPIVLRMSFQTTIFYHTPFNTLCLPVQKVDRDFFDFEDCRWLDYFNCMFMTMNS